MKLHAPGLPALLAAGILTGCGPGQPDGAATGAVERAAPAPPTRAAAGIDVAGMDPDVAPGDDFFAYANGTWLRTTEIPADRSNTGTFLEVYEKAERRTADLIRDAGASNPPIGSNRRKVADYYAAYMDEDAIERRGLDPLAPALAAIDAIATPSDLAEALGSRLRADVDPINATDFHTDHLFGLFVAQGLEDPSANIAYLLQGGLAMPSRDYYLSDDPAMRDFRAAYSRYVAALLEAAGSPDAAGEAATVIELETRIARAQAPLTESQDIHRANNLWAPADFPDKAPGLDWPRFFAAADLAEQPVVDVWQPEAIAKLAELTADAPLEDWKLLLRFHTIDRYASLLPRAFAELAFDFHARTLQGVPEQQQRWKRAVAATSRALGDAVGQLYVDAYFPASSKRAVEALVDDLLAAFDDHIETLDWMSPATKQKAEAKIETLRVSVGYPETWRDYSTLDVRADDALGNLLRAERHELAYRKAKLGRAVDRGEWWMTPQTVNAINLPLQNALNFPAAILEPPFFDPDADPAANYGAIGAVIGHEISHSFDNLGAEFDAQGRLANWWTDEDAARFAAAGEALAVQYDRYEALPGLHVNGEQTLGENIADLSGLGAAYLAYRASLAGSAAPVLAGFTGDERFFIAYAQTWRTKMRDAALRQRINTDVHAPGRFRSATVRNLDAWYDAFGVEPGAALYLAPSERVRIW